MTLELISDNFLLVVGPCDCHGDSECECWTVDGVRTKVLGECDLGPLLHNLAVAGALTRAFRLGDVYGWDMADNERLGLGQHTNEWAPNINGETA